MIIGPSFPDELEATGLIGLPFTWSEDGSFNFAPGFDAGKRSAILALASTHDPTKRSKASIRSEIAMIELTQATPVREILLDPSNATARNLLVDIEQRIRALRALL